MTHKNGIRSLTPYLPPDVLKAGRVRGPGKCHVLPVLRSAHDGKQPCRAFFCPARGRGARGKPKPKMYQQVTG